MTIENTIDWPRSGSTCQAMVKRAEKTMVKATTTAAINSVASDGSLNRRMPIHMQV